MKVLDRDCPDSQHVFNFIVKTFIVYLSLQIIHEMEHNSAYFMFFISSMLYLKHYALEY